MPRPKPLPPGLSGRPFRVADAAAAGISRARLRASDLRAPFRGIRMPAGTASMLDALRARMGPGEFVSHVTAARVYGIPLPARLERSAELHVSVLAPAFAPRVRGVHGHRLSSPVVVGDYRGLPIVSAADAWCQLAGFLTEPELVVAGDHLVRRKRPQSSMQELAEALERHGSARGVRMLRSALRRVRPGTDSPMETRVRLLLVDAGLPEPVIGHTVLNSFGEFVATPDLCYPRERIAIEYEGELHRTDPAVFAEDIERRVLLERAGWAVIRVIKDHVYLRPNLLVNRVRTTLADRAVP
ncbi:MAG TPA: hypothetical protein VGC18_13175 [Lacisediminihabitans sp.]|uniref:hypothetical protein n=1 Tax=Lacisediminihabitans sp. TaxID=2787631 RepID=UPI002ED7D86E